MCGKPILIRLLYYLMRKKLWVFVIATVVLLTWQFIHFRQKDKTRDMPLVAVETVQQKSILVSVNRFGTVVEHQSADIRALVTGILTVVKVVPGAEVNQGDILFIIDPRPYLYVRQKAKAILASEQAEYHNAELILKRNLPLLKKGYVSKQEIANLHTQLADKQAQMQAAENALSQAELDLEHTQIKAPFSGKIGDILLKQGNVITEKSSLITNLRSLKPIDVAFSLPQLQFADLQAMLKEHPVQVSIQQNQLQEVGQLQFVDNTIDQSTGTIALKAVFPNMNERLWPGQYVQVNIPIRELKNAIVIPTAALQSGQNGFYVYVLKKISDELKVEERSVAVQTTVQDQVVIEKGLKAGEQVVTSGQMNLSDKAKVRV